MAALCKAHRMAVYVYIGAGRHAFQDQVLFWKGQIRFKSALVYTAWIDIRHIRRIYRKRVILIGIPWLFVAVGLPAMGYRHRVVQFVRLIGQGLVRIKPEFPLSVQRAVPAIPRRDVITPLRQPAPAEQIQVFILPHGFLSC